VSALPPDYDTDPGRSRGRTFSVAGDTHEPVADRLVAEGHAPVLDMGCGRGRFADALAGRLPWIGLDPSPAQLADCRYRPVALAEATHVPFPDATFGAVVSLWVLYHLAEPALAVAEARRVLRPGGVFVACTTSRFDSPELVDECPATTFDAEEAPDIVASVFGAGAVQLDRWDAPLLRLPDRDAVVRYARSHFLPPHVADRAETPVTLTKRGVLVWARNR